MGRKSKAMKAMKASKSFNTAGDRVERISGKEYISLSGSTTAQTYLIDPTGFTRAAEVATLFAFFRFTKLVIRVIPSANSGSVALGFLPGAGPDTPPSTLSQIISLPVSTVHGKYKTVDTNLTIPRSELVSKAQLPWFKSFPGTPAKQFEIQGNVYYVADASVQLMSVWEYEIEFQSWILPANSPALGMSPSPVKTLTQKTKSESDDAESSILLIDGATYSVKLSNNLNNCIVLKIFQSVKFFL